MNNYAESLNNYRALNKSAEKNASVFFGADWLSNISISELARDNGIDAAVYNRSLKGLVLDDAEQVLDDCVLDLHPDKVFINIGENDIKRSNFNIGEFAEKYEWILYTIHSKCSCKIYILSVMNDTQNDVNEILQQIAEKYACTYIDIRSCRTSALEFFSKVRFFLRSHSVTFCDAFKI